MRGRGTSFLRKPPGILESDNLLAGMLIGQSQAIRDVATMIRQVALYPTTTVLLQGESGTGKDVVARAIHELSRRAAYQFVDINCAAIPEMLLETELFGVEAGAYTDAKCSREGHFLRADGGTLFLDEIGAMPLVLQAKLLRFLESFSFRRVGSTREIHVDLRVISATNVDLKTAVEHHAFRGDLFYRLNVITISLPPLRERMEDLELLVDHFLRMYAKEGSEPHRISKEALEMFYRHHWPGNIRELRSAIQHGMILSRSREIQPQDLPDTLCLAVTSANQRLQELSEQMHLPHDGIDLTTFLKGIEHTFIQEALERCNGNQVQAATLLHMSRDQLRYRLMHP
ncbi:MAG TPA: sigma-54 dependent transcriptional regulator [Ktedonobacteraceae bacterium]|nr:sigma-54 dependent transcriptional regulator [Ktedonobacteraceae bacterium]